MSKKAADELLDEPFTLALPAGLRAKLKQVAADNSCSQAAIVRRAMRSVLEQATPDKGQWSAGVSTADYGDEDPRRSAEDELVHQVKLAGRQAEGELLGRAAVAGVDVAD